MKEKEIKLFNAVTDIDSSLLAEAEKIPKRQHSKITKLLSIAACLLLAVLVSFEIIGRFDHLGFGCSAWPGDIVEGKYYFYRQHDGVFVYTPETKETEKLLSTFWFDGYGVKEDGVYYSINNRLKFLDFETEKSKTLFHAWGYSKINFEINPDDSINITCRNRLFDRIKKVRIDSSDGEILEVIHPAMTFNEHLRLNDKSSSLNFKGRHLTLSTSSRSTAQNDYIITENGADILPPDTFVSGYVWDMFTSNTNETLFFKGQKYSHEDAEKTVPLFIAITEDEVKSISLPFSELSNPNFTDDFIFFTDNEKVYCKSIDDNSLTELKANTESYTKFYSVTTDGNYLYATVPWDEVHEVWKIEKDAGGMPQQLLFYDENAAD